MYVFAFGYGFVVIYNFFNYYIITFNFFYREYCLSAFLDISSICYLNLSNPN